MKNNLPNIYLYWNRGKESRELCTGSLCHLHSYFISTHTSHMATSNFKKTRKLRRNTGGKKETTKCICLSNPGLMCPVIYWLHQIHWDQTNVFNSSDHFTSWIGPSPQTHPTKSSCMPPSFSFNVSSTPKSPPWHTQGSDHNLGFAISLQEDKHSYLFPILGSQPWHSSPLQILHPMIRMSLLKCTVAQHFLKHNSDVMIWHLLSLCLECNFPLPCILGEVSLSQPCSRQV